MCDYNLVHAEKNYCAVDSGRQTMLKLHSVSFGSCTVYSFKALHHYSGKARHQVGMSSTVVWKGSFLPF